jgi:hypothetical protein
MEIDKSIEYNQAFLLWGICFTYMLTPMWFFGEMLLEGPLYAIGLMGCLGAMQWMLRRAIWLYSNRVRAAYGAAGGERGDNIGI